MKTEDFDFALPKELIAQTPLKDRSASRLLVVDRASQSWQDRHFTDVVDYLRPDDVLVRNNTRVIPARLYGVKEPTGGHVEVLLLNDTGDNVWECLVGNARIVRPGTVIRFGDGSLLTAECVRYGDAGVRYLKMRYDGIFMEVLDRLGEIPLPPYIREKLQDPERYQTVYSKVIGSAAAPTAGLHFTPELLAKIRAKGVTIVDITLQIGLGTFRPVLVDDISEHQMHSERYEVTQEAADILNAAKAEGRRIVCVGTTSVRTLEAMMKKHGAFVAAQEDNDIFIYPGFRFEATDALITNFHLPKSTLIMMISAFGGKELIFSAYQHAIEERYRFFSFGDAMMIL
jgi:S-adenosylmethionine:tRNA ribosyltransferase-isomerase